VGRGVVQLVEREQDAAEFQVGAGGVWVAFERRSERFQRLFGAGLAIEKDSVVDSGILFGGRLACCADGGPEFGFGFLGPAERFQGEREQAARLSGLAEGEGAVQGVEGGGESIEEVEGAAVVQAGVLESRLVFTW